MELEDLAHCLGEAGANLTVEMPGGRSLRIGDDADRTRVVFHRRQALEALLQGNHLALAEAFLAGAVDIEGDLRQALYVTDYLELRTSLASEAWYWLRLWLDRRRFGRESIAFHYDRPPAFFLAWLDRWRSYTHGFYAFPDEDVTAAQQRKLHFVTEALDLQPGMAVLDVGCGWGSFLEYAGRQGIQVHGITISSQQYTFVEKLIREHALPCTIEKVDFLDHRPGRRYDAAVFMGSLEHIPDYRYVSRFVGRYVSEGGRIYADFVSSREGRLAGAFLRKHIFPGVSGYVHLGRLVAAITRAGFNVTELSDDTLNCAYTVRDWAQRLETARDELTARFGEATVRAFLLYLWSSNHFLLENRTQAYHLVASRFPAGTFET
jgi:cyclopropane-fatty-acyl-phospholipid synthase